MNGDICFQKATFSLKQSVQLLACFYFGTFDLLIWTEHLTAGIQ